MKLMYEVFLLFVSSFKFVRLSVPRIQEKPTFAKQVLFIKALLPNSRDAQCDTHFKTENCDRD